MTTQQTDPVIAGLEARIEQHQKTIAALEQALTVYREAMGVPVVPREQKADAPVTRRAAARPSPRPKAAPEPTSPADEKLEAQLLAYLGRQSKPVRPGAVAAHLTLSRTAFARLLDPLLADERVVKTGVTSGTRIGLPAVMREAESAKEEDSRG